MIPAILRQRLGTNEIIVTLMMNYIAILLLEYLVYGIWKDPASYGFPMTPMFSEQAIVGKIGTSGVNSGIFHCLVLGVLFWIFFTFTRTGFELKASGDSVRAARYAGIPYNYLVVLVMVLSGALAGWAGFLEASATINRLQPSIMVGYGYTAIVVAWLARLNPLNIAITSFLLAGLRVGVESLQLDMQVPAAFGGMIEGLILMTVLASGFFVHYKMVPVRKQ
jgi:simple sugar transport system permease protein